MFRKIVRLFKSFNIQNIHKNTQAGSSEVEIFINGRSVTVPSYYSVMQAIRRERITIPSFCYHERLSIVGNCRMCIVDIEGWGRRQVACSVPVSKGMRINTNSEITQLAQEAVLEFILVDHPLDCPICDQGGECDLQDLSMKFGNDRSRFTDIHFEGKRAVENKYLGPLIRAEMTRCIHCTRCIRFASQICGLDVLGTTGRGTDMLVGTYVDKMFLSELSGNIIDLCPVGSLTSIPYMFKARPWEIKRKDSIDCTDATGTNIILNYKSDRLLRVLPKENEEINQEWLSDKGRWAIDSLNMQRLVAPMVRERGCLLPVDWDWALKVAGSLFKTACPNNVMAIAGPHTNVETLVTAKDFLNMLGSEHTYVECDLYYGASGIDIRAGYSLNINMKAVAKADKIVFVGTNPRFEAPILNARIREAYMMNECDIYVVGPKCDYNYYVNYLGEDINSLSKITSALSGAKRPLIFVGIAQLATDNAPKIMQVLTDVAKSIKVEGDWNVINIVTRDASFAGALECGWKPGALAGIDVCDPKLIISLGADQVFYEWTPPPNCPVIYIGFQGDRAAECASVILPGSAYTEAGGVYLNMEGRSQYAYPAITPPGNSRFDWKIVRALAEYSGICLYYSDTYSLCNRMGEISPNFVQLGMYQPKVFANLIGRLLYTEDCNASKASDTLNVDLKELKDYYCSDVFSRNSPTMIKAQKAACELAKCDYASI